MNNKLQTQNNANTSSDNLEDIPIDFKLDAYNYSLPSELIAQHPVNKQGTSRLLIMNNSNTSSTELIDNQFENIVKFLPSNALLVANNVKVFPCRLSLTSPNGGKGEFLLLTPLPELLKYQKKNSNQISGCAVIECLLRPAKRFKVGHTYSFASNLQGKVIEKLEFGKHVIELSWSKDISTIFHQYGKLPLPPYIQREVEEPDQIRYQTCYAKVTGAMAAPTAGLHFTQQIRDELLTKTIDWQEITLYVGYGTFNPVRSKDIRKHKMHSELLEISKNSANAINRAKQNGRPIIAIGTTSLRTLESSLNNKNEVQSGKRWTDIFIYPGYEFKIVDGLITNFHLPQSSLLMLVSAFIGRENILSAYQHAIKKSYRFFSYGDAMFIRKNK